MKHRIFNTIDNDGDRVELIFVDVGNMSLGNNFTLDHFFDALGAVVIDYLYNLPYNGYNTIFRLKGSGNYGKVQVTLCAHDFTDYLRSQYKSLYS